MNFIPANESRVYIWFFSHYTRWLLKRRFKQVWVKQAYFPKDDARTVYYLNHNSWWDGLLPLYLNHNFFHQKARALMEDKQMSRYPFFSKIGAFSISLENSRASIVSLRYAIKSLERSGSCLFIYPEGKITPASESAPKFKPGLAWLYAKTTNIDYIPVAIYQHSLRGSKPELYLSIGNSVKADNKLDSKQLTDYFEHDIHRLISEIRAVAGFSDEGFTPKF